MPRHHSRSDGGAPAGFTDRHPTDSRSILPRLAFAAAVLAGVGVITYSCAPAHAEPIDRAAAIAALNAVPAVQQPPSVSASVPDARLVTGADVKTYPATANANVTPPSDCLPLTAYSRTGAITPAGARQFTYRMLASQDTITFPCANGTVYLILAYRR